MKTTVIIVGAGITGIGAAYYLRKQGIDYLILEAKDDLGGVWHTHRWHGARCDSDFIKYSFSFRPYLSGQCLQGQEQIQRYLRDVATEFGILPRIRFATRVQLAVFDEASECWTVHTDRGRFQARFLVNGNGYFSDEPYVPAIPGAERFGGQIVHTSHLDRRRRFDRKRVVLVGSGATAICCAPELARVSGSLVMLQRSPTYIFETSNRAGPLVRACQALYRRGFRAAIPLLRWLLQLRDDLVFVGFRRFPALARGFFRRHWRAAVSEAFLRAHLTPRYNPWQQRIAVAIGLKQMLASGAIQVKTGEIARFGENGLVLRNGEVVPCDVCVLATGLNLRFFSFDIYVGERRVALERINFFRGLMVGGIPNYFHPMGSWHSAWTQRLEPVMRVAVRIIAHMQKQGIGSVRVRRRELPASPGITPNYVLRCLDTMPRMEGTLELPSLDNLFTLLWAACLSLASPFQWSAPRCRSLPRR